MSRPEFGALAGTLLVIAMFGISAGGSGMFNAEGIVNWSTVAAYLGVLAVGAALAILLQWEGFVLLGVTAVLIWLMVYIIDPKLRAVSAEYEKRQQAYLKELDQITRWEA